MSFFSYSKLLSEVKLQPKPQRLSNFANTLEKNEGCEATSNRLRTLGQRSFLLSVRYEEVKPARAH